MNCLKVFMILAFLCSCIHSQNVETELENDLEEIPNQNTMSKMKNIAILLGKKLEEFTKATPLGFIMSGVIHNDSIVSEECKTSMKIISSEIAKFKFWAIKFLDSTAKIPAGLLQGSLTVLGSYDECLDINQKVENETILGHYCPINFVPNATLIDMIKKNAGGSMDFLPTKVSLNLRWDICLPSTCTPEDIENALLTSFDLLHLRSIILPKVIRCDKSTKKDPYNYGEIIAMVVFAILGAFLFFGTFLDISFQTMNHFDIKLIDQESLKERTISKVFLSFSCFTNGRKLLNTDMASDSLTSINGVRFLSMTWVIIGHSYFFINASIVGNLKQADYLPRSFPFQAVLNATVSVDSFFLLSGLLVAYVTMKSLRQNGSVNWGLYYFHRIWRLTPAYALVILFTILWPLVGSGPTWNDQNADMVTNCENYWWSALLYIGNLYKPEFMCLSHGWYLANDMQFYIVSPLILMAMYKKPKLGMVINFAFLITTIITTAILGYTLNLPPTTLFFDSNQANAKDYFPKVYITPWCRMGPYCVGLYVGYFLSTTKKLNLKMRYHAILWCTAITCNMLVLYGVYDWNKGHHSSLAVNAFYLSTHRTVWALGLAWVIIACTTGHGGIVNTILSWKAFAPLGRMTYCAYLIHPMVQLAYSGLIRERIIYTDYTWVTMSLGFLLSSYGFAFAATLAIEAPFLGLEKIFLKKSEKKPELIKSVSQESDHVENGDALSFDNQTFHSKEEVEKF